MRTAYKCRAYPDPEQVSVLARTFGCVRVVWNRTLAWRHARYHGEQVKTGFTQANAYLTAMKATEELAWLNEVSSVPLQQAIRHQQVAFTNFFAKRARYPRFKSRNGRQSAEYTRSGFRYRGGQLWLAKMDVPLTFTWSWPDIDPASIDPAAVTISHDPCGRWYVSFAVEVAEPEQLPATGRAVGVDLGIKDFAVTSDGEKIANPRKLARRERNLARYQRRMARCQRGSANRAKAKAKVARAHRKVRASRADFLHTASTNLVRDHDVIAVEDLAVRNMVRNRSLARAISDCGWGTFRRMAEYKAKRAGRHVIPVDRWYPSSKTCSSCGYLLTELSLKTRHWTCPACRTRHDRDINAAKNILAAGLAVARSNPGDACGADVRHSGSSRVQSAVKQEPQPARAGIPSFRAWSSQPSGISGCPAALASGRSIATSASRSGVAWKNAASVASTMASARMASPVPRSVTRSFLARVSAVSTVRVIRPLASSLRRTSEVIFTSAPACRASVSWFGSSPREFSHQAVASSTNCTWVRSSGVSAAAISRCQRRVACQSRDPGLCSGSSGTG